MESKYFIDSERVTFIEEKVLPMDTKFQRDFFYKLCELLPSAPAELTLDSEGRLRILRTNGDSSCPAYGYRPPANPQTHVLNLPIIEMYVLDSEAHAEG